MPASDQKRDVEASPCGRFYHIPAVPTFRVGEPAECRGFEDSTNLQVLVSRCDGRCDAMVLPPSSTFAEQKIQTSRGATPGP